MNQDAARSEPTVFMEPHVTKSVIGAVMAAKPSRFACLNAAFDGDDAPKTDAVLQMRDAGVEFRTV
jgi:adenine-specific DNA-methyltransferase